MLRHLLRPAPASAHAWRIAVPAHRALSNPAGAEEDIVHRSALPTDHFQASLPRLGVPKLEKTLERYLASQSVLLSGDALAAHQRLVAKFGREEGPRLQSSLQAFAKARPHTSYITDFWFDMYLRDRRPVVLTHTPFMEMTKDPTPAMNAPDVRATNLIYSSVRVIRALREGCLSPEVFHLNAAKSDTDQFRRAVSWAPNRIATYVAYLFKAYPLDMSQFVNLFGSTRLPRPDKDELKVWPNSRHVVVMRGGHMYSFDVMDTAGRAVAPTQILANIQHILGLREDRATDPLGAMSTADRDTWTKVRERMLEVGNAELLEELDSALFVFSLDDVNLEGQRETKIRSFLHGLTPNRWFDKCFMLMMDPGGNVALSFEHSWGDGVAVMRYFLELHKDSMERPVVHPDTQVPAGVQADVHKLEFKLDDGLRTAFRDAWTKHKERFGELEVEYREYEHLTRNDVKRAKLSPDAVMQLLLQMAYHRMSGKAAPTYESCSTSAFKHGRTETLRSGTPETLAFSKMVEAGTASPSELMEALHRCSKKHNQLMKEAAMGQGWDRHLFALRKMAEADMPNQAVPLFTDPAYAYINHIIISTSTLPVKAVTLGGFAAVENDGYGIGYGIVDRGLGFIVTAYPRLGGISMLDFFNSIGDCVTDMKAVLDGQTPKR